MWIKESRCYLVTALMVLGVDIFASTSLPFCFKTIVEGFERKETLDALMGLAGVFFIATLIVKTASYIQDLLFYPVINATIRELHFKIAAHIHDLSLSDYQTLSIPEVISFQKRIGMSVRFFMRILLVSIAPTLFKLVAAMGVILSINILRAPLIIALMILFVTFFISLSWYLTMRRKAWDVSDGVTLALGDSILNTKLVRFYKSFELTRLRNLVTTESNAWFSMTMRMDMVQVFLGIIIALTLGGVIAVGVWRVHAGEMTVGTFILLHGQLTALFIPFKQMLTDMRQLCEASIDFEKIVQIFDLPPQHRVHTLPSFDPHKPCISFDHVAFAYDGKKNVFSNVSFDIKVGERVLIFGISGAGKSTLLHLLTGLMHPSHGTVALWGQDTTCLDLEDVGKRLHFIPQEVPLFNGTFLDNVTFGVGSYTQNDLDQALQAVQLHHRVQQWEDGLLTNIGQMGAKLSGGEKQRLALARTLILKPQILIFDETTNAMDFEMEQRIFDAVATAIPTIIFISHRKTLHHNLHRTLELSNGKIIERTE